MIISRKNLKNLGFNLKREEYLESLEVNEPDYLARIFINHGNHVEIALSQFNSIVYKTVRFTSNLNGTPIAGDWVIVSDDGFIKKILPRYTELSRPDNNGTRKQALASNIDVIMLVVSLEVSPNLKSIEKLLVMGWDSGAIPVLVLTKSDTCNDIEFELSRIKAVALGIETIVCSASTGIGLDTLKDIIQQGTCTMLGASGVGKATLLNALFNVDEATQPVKRGGQGRHTTTTRKLYTLPSGGAMLDIPGIRTLAVGDNSSAMNETFADIFELSIQCRFTDCSHEGDSGCAVESAIESGLLPRRRLESWRSVQREMAYQQRKSSPELMAQQRKIWKKQTKDSKRKQLETYS